MTSDQENAQKAAAQVCRVILGKEKEVREVMTAILANGHILLEDIPGVGKTTLLKPTRSGLPKHCNTWETSLSTSRSTLPMYFACQV